MGKGTSELQAVLEEIRQLDARLTACERDLIRLAREVGGVVAGRGEVEGSRSVAGPALRDEAALGLAGGVKAKSRRVGRA